MRKLLCVMMLVSSAGSASASLIYDMNPFSSVSVVDFSQFTATTAPGYILNGPVDVGGLVGESITLKSTNSSSILGNANYGLPYNGVWDSGRDGFAGLNTSYGYMDFTFSNSVSAIGGFLNYPTVFTGFEAPTISALGSTGNILETYDLLSVAPISTPGATNAGAFRGIFRHTADIFGFRLTNGYLAIDDLAFARISGCGPSGGVPPKCSPFNPAVVPLPASLPLLLAGLAGLAFWRRKKA